MIWTAITYSIANEKIECKVYEAPMDFTKAYGVVTADTGGIVLSLIKGNHEAATYIPQIDLKLTRAQYRGEF